MSDPSEIPPPADTPPPSGALTVTRQEHPVLTAGRGAFFGLFYLNLLLTVLTLGIYRFWAKTKMRRLVWRHVIVAGEGFEYTGTGKELLIGFLKALLVLFPPLLVLGIVRMLLD